MTQAGLMGNAFDATVHFNCSATRERQQQDGVGLRAVVQQIGDTVRERRRFAGARTGNDQ
jgi:hypothetical protein